MTNDYVVKILNFTHAIFPRCRNIKQKFAFSSKDNCKSKILILKQGKAKNIITYIKEAEKGGIKGLIIENKIDKEYLPKNIPLLRVQNLSENLNAILNHIYSDPMKNMYVIGVTGTDGKTSTCHHVAQFLSYIYPRKKIGMITSEGNGIYPKLSKTEFTTPDSHILYSEYDKFRKNNVKIIIIECSSQGLAQGRLNSHSFNLSILTNINRDHIDYHKTISRYINSKMKLLEMTNDFILINNDNKKININNSQAKKIFYKTRDHSYKLMKISTSTDLIKKIAAILNIKDQKKIGSAISNLKPIKGRFNIFKGKNNQTIIVDYAHTSSSFLLACKSVVNTFNLNQQKNKLLIVFGCGGDRDKSKRKEMGKIASKYADHIILTDDNPRSENPKNITYEISQALMKKTSYEIINNRKMAIKKSIKLTSADDIVLIIGKGNEPMIMYNNKKVKHNDIEYINTLIR